MPPRLATRAVAPQEAPVALPAPRLAAQALADAVSARVGAARFNLWVADHARFVPLGGSVVVAARNQHTREWLEHTFGASVKEAVADVCGSGVGVRWAVDDFEEARSAERGARNEKKRTPSTACLRS